MKGSIVLNATAVSVKGISNLENEGNFLLNGKSLLEIDQDSVRVTVDTVGNQFLYSICGSLGHKSSRKSSAAMLMTELRNLQGRFADSYIPVDRRVEHIKECFDDTQNAINKMNIIKDSIEPDRTLFSSISIYNDTAAVYTTGLGCALLARDSELNELDPLRSFNIKQGDVFLLCSYNVIKTIGPDKLCDMLLSGNDTALSAEAITAEMMKSSLNTDITMLVVRISKINETEILKMEKNRSAVDELENQSQLGFSEKISKFYDKKQETLRTIVAAVLTCIVAAAVILTVFKILTGEVYNAPAGNKTSAKSTVTTQTGKNTTENASTPTATPSGTTAKITTGTRSYTIKSGDSLSRIAKEFYGSEAQEYIKLIQDANDIEDAAIIHPGDVIQIPPKP